MARRELDPRENLRKWKLSRRRFLQIIGLAGAGAAVSTAAPRIARGFGQTEEDGAGSTIPPEIPEAEAGAAAAPPVRTRKWMRILDLRRCDGCQSQGTPPQCTEACNFGHFLPEPMEWIEVYEHEIDADAKYAVRLREGQGRGVEGTYFVPTPCMQCQNPPCVNVCPVGATWSVPEGIVVIDNDRCIGCRMCMAACPYERRFYVWSDPPIPAQAVFVEPAIEHQIPLQKGVVAKCYNCLDLLRTGRVPLCVAACPQGALYQGDFEEDLATNGNEVVRVSRFLAENSAWRQKDELGTRPRVYYISGHGELAGRDPRTRDRLPVTWDYTETMKGSRTWKRSGR
ncbi:MAG: 4Fe-4S dicluster domain-containing protein [Dehalococcoidia bacterium]